MPQQSRLVFLVLAGLALMLAGCGESSVVEYSLYSSSWGGDSKDIVYFEGVTRGRSKPALFASELLTDSTVIVLKRAMISGDRIASDATIRQFTTAENPVPSVVGYSQPLKAVFYSRASDSKMYIMKYDLDLNTETTFVEIAFSAVQIQVSPKGDMLAITEPKATTDLISKLRVFNLATGAEIYTTPAYNAYGVLLWMTDKKVTYQVDPNQVATLGAVHSVDLSVVPVPATADARDDTVTDLSTAVRNHVYTTLSPDGSWLFVLDALHEAKIVSAR